MLEAAQENAKENQARVERSLDKLQLSVDDLKQVKANAQENQVWVKKSLDKLQSSVDDLQQVKARVLGVLAVLSLVGLLAVGFFVYLWSQLTSLNKQIGKAGEQVKAVSKLANDNKTLAPLNASRRFLVRPHTSWR